MTTTTCKGYGECLAQSDCNNGYTKSDTMSCSHNCQPMKCPNYLICGHIRPEWFLNCHKGLCMTPCAISFKYLHFVENKECPVCLETTICVKQLKCEHLICVECFKRCHLPPYWNDTQPEFPYDSELEEEYECQWDNPRWRNDPLIQKYEEDSKKWQIDREIREENESYLKVCPLCRK